MNPLEKVQEVKRLWWLKQKEQEDKRELKTSERIWQEEVDVLRAALGEDGWIMDFFNGHESCEDGWYAYFCIPNHRTIKAHIKQDKTFEWSYIDEELDREAETLAEAVIHSER